MNKTKAEMMSMSAFICPVCSYDNCNNWAHGCCTPNCEHCGYTRPSDKQIIELHSQGLDNQKIMEELKEPNIFYIVSILKKFERLPNLYEKICKECGNQFLTSMHNRIYCEKCKYYGLEDIFRICVVCGKEFKPFNRIAKLCSEKCRIIYRKKWTGEKKLGHPKIFECICPTCGKEFETKKWSRKYCSDECRPKRRYPSTKKEVIEDMRDKFLDLKKVNPEKAQVLADKMEKEEGPWFKEMALDGLVPLGHPYIKKEELILDK